MSLHPGIVLRRSAALFAAGLLLLPRLPAYEAPLGPEAVREAYFLGQRNDETREKFLETYKKHFALPEKGPYVSEIELLTPFAQVVDVSRQHTLGYSAQLAAEDYKKRGDWIRVRVQIGLTPTYGPVQSAPKSKDRRAEQGITLRQEDFWKNFKARLLQGGEEIDPIDKHGEPIFLKSGTGSGGLAGAQMWFYYDAGDVASSEATVEVVTPEGLKVTARFDLEKLR